MRTLTDWQTYIQGKINTLLGTSGYPSADFYAGSVIDTITLMMAYLTNFTEKSIEYYKNQAWIVTADYPYLALKAVDFGVTVDTGSKSTGTCTFSRETNTGVVTIPLGTKVAVNVELGSLQFQTTAVGTIADGDYSVDIAVESVLVGADKNVEPTTIRYFVDAVAGVDSVENATATSGGTDGDTTETLRDKLLLFIQNLSRGTTDAIRYRAGIVTGVSSVHIEERPDGEMVYNSDDEKATYYGTWTTVTDADYYWGEAKYTETATDYMEFVFSGEESIQVVFGGTDVYSEVEVYLDSVLQETYNIQGEVATIDSDVMTTSTAKHTLKIVLNSGKLIVDSFKGVTTSERDGVIDVFVDDGSGTASWTILNNVKTALEDWRACGIRYNIKRCEIELIDLTIQLLINSSVDKARLKSQISSDIAEYLTTIDAGEMVYINNLYGHINNQTFNGRKQVITSVITSPTEDVQLDPYTIARLGTVTYVEIT
jgi:hypothetical protein